jgi:hypothetical protein
MMSHEMIRSLSREAAGKAAKLGKRPFVIEAEDLIDWQAQISAGKVPSGLRTIPNLGDYRPKGWKLIDSFMVDSSGMGAEDEPALTLRGFVQRLNVGMGYGLISAGQFQVVVGEFQKVAK